MASVFWQNAVFFLRIDGRGCCCLLRALWELPSKGIRVGAGRKKNSQKFPPKKKKGTLPFSVAILRNGEKTGALGLNLRAGFFRFARNPKK